MCAGMRKRTLAFEVQMLWIDELSASSGFTWHAQKATVR